MVRARLPRSRSRRYAALVDRSLRDDRDVGDGRGGSPYARWFRGTSYSEVLAVRLGKLSEIEVPEGEVPTGEALIIADEVRCVIRVFDADRDSEHRGCAGVDSVDSAWRHGVR